MRHDPGMIYGLVFPVFGEDAARGIARFRARHEPERARLVAPHITLMFGVSSVPSEHLIALAERAAQEFGPFTVEFTDFSISHDPFEKAEKLMLNVTRGVDALISLHDGLYDGPHRAELHPDIPYHPHMTVATNPDPAIVRALNVDEIGALPLTGMVEALEIVRFDAGRLHPVQRVKLGKSIPL